MAKSRKRKREEKEKNENQGSPNAAQETEKRDEQEKIQQPNPISEGATEKRGEQEKNDLPKPIASDETELRGEQEKNDLPKPIASDQTEERGEPEKIYQPNPVSADATEKRGVQEKNDLPNLNASEETEKIGGQEKKDQPNPETFAEKEIRIRKIFEEFHSSTAKEYKIEEHMAKRERKLVHHISESMGLTVSSVWCGEKLIYTIHRKRNKVINKARKKEAEEAKKKEAEEAKKKEAEEASKKEGEEASKKLAEETSKKEAEEASKKLAEEANNKLAEEVSKKEAEEASKKKAEEASKKKTEEANKKLAEEASKKLAEEARKKLAEEARKKWAEEARKKWAEEASKKEAEEARKEEAEQAKKEGKEARKKEGEEARKKAYKEARKKGIESKKKFYRTRNMKIQWMKRRNKNPTPLTFSEEAKVVLQDLFLRYPPDDGELEKKNMIGNHGEKTRKIMHGRDSMFCKPSMGKAEIAKKLEKLNSKMVQDSKLRQISEARAKLPIASFRDVITLKTESHQVVLISGETGCGKTTQVPQYILDHMWGKGESCKILCTQPRRISATSVAERISAERGEPIGNDVGYKIRLESKGGKHSSIIFMTNGVLLRVLVSKENARLKNEASKSLAEDNVSDITYIIVDEIHERDRYSDIMLAILRDMLPSHPHLRLILMSATLDAGRFSDYFGGCPVISVPGFTYPVKNFYLEDVLSIVKSAENKHLESDMLTIPLQNREFTEKDKVALDESINLAWSNDEFDPLLEFISSEGSAKVYNYQHSSTGLTPLMVFAGKGRVGDVCMLLSLGVDCTLQAKDGTTALELAERENQQEAADVIKRHVKGSHSNSVEEQRLLDTYLSSFNPLFIDVVLIEMLLKKICNCTNEGAILVFLPGWDDINKIRDKLLVNRMFEDESKFMILPLHSRVPSTEQKKVFQRPPVGCRKIVLSTNMAETSVTIDDIVYVLDTGRMKEKSYDPINNVSTLQTSWISKASAKQRAGRAGRCQPGICYHLYSKLQASSLSDYQVPEIQRVSLDELCLQVKLLNPNFKIADFLQKTLDPPIPKTISNAIGVLQDVGALTSDESLTEFGEKLASFPVHPLKCRMLLFAILMNCLDPALTLACASDSKDPFTLPMSPDEKEKAARCKYELASLYGGQSDQLAVIAAFDCWRIAKERGQEKEFCSQFFISRNTMRLLGSMRMKLLQELIRCGFILGDPKNCSLNVGDPGILHAVLVAGSYPRVGRLRPPHNSGRRLIEIANGEVVRLHTQSTNFRSVFQTNDDCPFVLFDEITRSDSGMLIRSCTVVGPLPLLLFAMDIVVFPGNDINDDHSSKEDIKEDGMEIDGENDDKIMSSPDKSVKVVVDNWLPFKSMAIDVAQIYCLRERLDAAILFKVLNPQVVIPPDLEASMYALSRFLSCDGLSGIAQPLDPQNSTQNAAMKDKSLPLTTVTDPLDPVNAPTSTGNATETDKSVSATTGTGLLDPVNGPTSSGNATEIDKSLSVTTGTGPMAPVNGLTSTVSTTEIAKSSPETTGQTLSDANEIDKSSLQDKDPGPRDILVWLLTPMTSQTEEMMIDPDPGQTSQSPAPKQYRSPAGKRPGSAKYPNQKPHAKSPRFVGHGSGRSQNYPSYNHHHKNTRQPYDIAVKESDPGQSAKSPALKASKTKQKTPAKITTLVGYGSTRYGPYGPRAGATKQQRKGGSRW